MKTKFGLFFTLILVVILSACAGDIGDVSEEGFEFTEEEAAEPVLAEGFDFTDGEALVVVDEQGFVFEEDEGDDVPGMDFDDDDGLELPDQDIDIFPPEGMTNWLIKHDDGTATCPSQTIPIWGNEPEMVTISLGAGAQSLVVSGMDGGPEIFYLLERSGPGGSLYNGYFQPPGATAEIHYQILFANLVDSSVADYLMGSIAAEEQGCKISRSFQGNRVD
jgi:hypothetical protein